MLVNEKMELPLSLATLALCPSDILGGMRVSVSLFVARRQSTIEPR